MKKFFTLCMSLLALGTVAQAQIVSDEELDESYVFTDLEGNEVADGSVIVVTELNEEGQMVVPLKTKNVSGDKVAVSMYEDISQKPNGGWQTCAFGNCMQLETSGYSPKSIQNDGVHADIQTEWIPEEGGYATWEAKLQLHIFNITKKSQFGQTIESAGNEIIGYGPTVTVRFEYKDPNQQEEQKSQNWWSYIDNTNYRTGLGTGKVETYNQAIYLDGNNPVFADNAVKSVRFYLRKSIKDVKLWVSKSLPASADKADFVMNLDASDLKMGDEDEQYFNGLLNEVELPTPYTIPAGKGVYVGCTFTVTSVDDSSGQYPIVLSYEDGVPGSCYLFTPTTGEWGDLAEDYGPLAMEVLIEGEFMSNAVSVEDFGEVVAVLGGSTNAQLVLTNGGEAGISSFDYTITAGTEVSAERHFDMPQPLTKLGGSTTVTLPFEADAQPSSVDKVLTITKVNGQPNEVEAEANFTMTTVSELVKRGIAVEEFTGTTCGWCPRGLVGMEKMRKEFGDAFVGIGVHRYTTSATQDAMYISTYNQVTFGGAPSCRINRGPVIDPYYGSGSSIFNDFRAEQAIPAKVGVEVTGEWNADSTKVEATATLKAVVPDNSFKIEYVLIADSLTGNTAAWRQYNFYNKAYGSYTDPSQLPADLGFLVNEGEIFNNQYVAYYPIFNDVAIAVAKSSQTTAPGVLNVGEAVTNSFTLSMPTRAALKAAITNERVAVIALVIDEKTGLIANAAKFYMPGYNGAEGVKGVKTTTEGTQTRYSLDGRQLPAAQKGLNIVRMGDGSVRKVIVK